MPCIPNTNIYYTPWVATQYKQAAPEAFARGLAHSEMSIKGAEWRNPYPVNTKQYWAFWYGYWQGRLADAG